MGIQRETLAEGRQNLVTKILLSGTPSGVRFAHLDEDDEVEVITIIKTIQVVSFALTWSDLI